MTVEEQVYRENLELNRLEYQAGRIHLWSRPRFLGLVLGNACNLNCRHCYQAKNGDQLLRPADIGRELRREIAGFYPYLSALRLIGGEVFALDAFGDIVEDVRSAVLRPILSISTNGTLVDETWAERIVRTPFASVTFSIDGATPETMAKLRGGADLGAVLGGIRRVQEWKRRVGSELPRIDAFFVIMRSNFREIPAFLRIMRENAVREVALQTMEVNAENVRRSPTLEHDEAIASREEAVELHALLRDALERERPRFCRILVSGLESLFAAHGLDAAFLCEREQGLYPESSGLDAGGRFACCPNPWTTLFVSENGGAHLCFLAAPIGNIYDTPLASIWNSAAAVAKRSDVLAGRYLQSACSKRWCSWREGTAATGEVFAKERSALAELARRAIEQEPMPAADEPVAAVRRAMHAREERIAEYEGLFADLCRTNQAVHEYGQQYITELEERVRELSRANEEADARAQAYERRLAGRLVRAAERVAEVLHRLVPR